MDKLILKGSLQETWIWTVKLAGRPGYLGGAENPFKLSSQIVLKYTQTKQNETRQNKTKQKCPHLLLLIDLALATRPLIQHCAFQLRPTLPTLLHLPPASLSKTKLAWDCKYFRYLYRAICQGIKDYICHLLATLSSLSQLVQSLLAPCLDDNAMMMTVLMRMVAMQ